MQNIINDTVCSFIQYNEISALLDKISFPYCILKGKPLALQAYGELSLRHSADIDILVSKENVCLLEDLLQQHKFECRNLSREERILCFSSSHQIPPYRKYKAGIRIEIDVNFDIFWGEFSGRRVSIKEFLSDTIDVNVYGVSVKTLPPLKALVQLILHHYKELNSIYHIATHSHKFKGLLRDIYYLIVNNKDSITIPAFYSISIDYGIVPYVYYILFFTNCIYKDTYISEFLRAFQCAEGIALIDYYGLSEMERKKWRVSPSARLSHTDWYSLINKDLTASDFEKLERNIQLFR